MGEEGGAKLPLGGGSKLRFKVSACKLRSNKLEVLLTAGNDLLLDVDMVTAENIYDGNFQKRDVDGLLVRVETCSNRLAGFGGDDDGTRKEAMALADNLYAESLALKARWDLYERCRAKPLTCLNMDVSDQQTRRVLAVLPRTLGVKIATSICSAATLRISPSKPNCLSDLFIFMRTVDTKALTFGQLSLSETDEEAAENLDAMESTQTMCVVNAIEQVMKVYSADEFVNAWKSLRTTCSAFPIADAFNTDTDECRDRALGWTAQVVTDCRAVTVMEHVLERETSGRQGKALGKDHALTTLVKDTIEKKSNVSLRLKAFRGRPTKGLNLGRLAWTKTEELVASSVTTTDVQKRVLQVWSETGKEKYKLNDGPEALDVFIGWLEDGTAEEVKGFAESFKELRGNEDEDVVAAKQRLRELVVTARQLGGEILADSSFCSFVGTALCEEVTFAGNEEGEDASGEWASLARNMEICELGSACVAFADDLENCVEPQRAETEVLDEVRNSVELFLQALRLVKGGHGDASSSDMLVQWSEAHTKKSDRILVNSVEKLSWLDGVAQHLQERLVRWHAPAFPQ